MWLGGEQINGVHAGIGFSSLLDSLNGLSQKSCQLLGPVLVTWGKGFGLTGYVTIENIVFFDNIVDNLLGSLVHDQAFPLQLPDMSELCSRALDSQTWFVEVRSYVTLGYVPDLLKNDCTKTC